MVVRWARCSARVKVYQVILGVVAVYLVTQVALLSGIVSSKTRLPLKSSSSIMVERITDKHLFPGPDIPFLNLDVFNNQRYDGRRGFDTARRVRTICSSMPKTDAVIWEPLEAHISSGYIYCPVEKVGTTFWHRVLYLLEHRNVADGYKQPYEVPIETALAVVSRFSYNLTDLLQFRHHMAARPPLWFYFVRNPYSRLLSAYIDKLVPPNPFYWEKFGVQAIIQNRKPDNSSVSGHDVTFSEFVKYVIEREETGENVDIHFMSVFKKCFPCSFKYNFVGRMESFENDSLALLERMGLGSAVMALQKGFKRQWLDDSIVDSVASTFKWKENVSSVISWDMALRRTWLKLQLKGIIKFSQKYPLNVTASESVSETKFIHLARKAHHRSSPGELKRQQLKVLTEAYSLVTAEDILKLQKVFRYDFLLYGYDVDQDFLSDIRRGYGPVGYFSYPELNNQHVNNSL